MLLKEKKKAKISHDKPHPIFQRRRFLKKNPDHDKPCPLVAMLLMDLIHFGNFCRGLHSDHFFLIVLILTIGFRGGDV